MSDAQRLRIITLNTRGGRHPAGGGNLAALAALLRTQAPDLVALQEVLRLPAPGWDFSRRLARDTGLRSHFASSIGLGSLGYGNALLTRHRVGELRRHRLPGTGEPRTAIEARCRFGATQVRVLNTHLGLDAGARLLQAAALADLVRREPGPWLLLGDWNAAPESPEVQLLVEAGCHHCLPPECATFPAHAPNTRVDYILASGHFRVARAHTLATDASDHLPVVVDLELRLA